jgi:prepilin-type N-terminal cleavage/methylation domain-containing protein
MVTKNKLKGFTIVELLIVIIIIGVLAAITVVSFTGITAKANTASEQSAANAVIAKSLMYKAPNAQYPTKIGILTSLPSSDSAYLTGVTSSTSLTAAPATPYNTVSYILCGTKSGGAAVAASTDFTTDGTTWVAGTTVTGIIARYWDFTTGAVNPVLTGVVPTIDSKTIYDGQVVTANSINVGCAVSAY